MHACKQYEFIMVSRGDRNWEMNKETFPKQGNEAHTPLDILKSKKL